ncbi:MAG TPA: D-alanyl-D-alanine carboxypeptidase [Micropepsaceae bacterium]|nr:D-alanyl-D-alanine carboxypeptidase [Micropepsaceae bacterium]
MLIKGLYRSRAVLAVISALSLMVPALLPVSGALAATHRARPARVERVQRDVIPSPEKDAAIVVDGATGKALYERNPDAIRYPASLTKMMTLYLLFEALEKGTISLDTPMYASSHAVAMSPTKLYVPLGGTIDVDTAVKAITVLSANDVAVIIAEALGGGSEATFADMMTERAHQLGMTNTNFHNASGLPDLQQLTTARDMAVLARHLAYDFPQYFHYFSAPSVTFHGRSYFNHDHLLNEFDGTDGIKTGYTMLSGFNLVSSVVRDNKHVIGVVMGGPTAGVRDREMMELLSATFAVEAQNPNYLADANVPWYGGAGPGADLFKANPGEDNYLVTYLDQNKGHVPILARLKNAPAVPGGQATVIATGSSPAGAAASPLLKPIGPSVAAGPQIAQGDETQNAAVVPFAPRAEAMKNWVVQIGVFADQALAHAKLATMARRSVDLLGQAEQIVATLPGRHGRMVYRARFGVFAEDEARGICAQMKRRRQSCIAVPEAPGAADRG